MNDAATGRPRRRWPTAAAAAAGVVGVLAIGRALFGGGSSPAPVAPTGVGANPGSSSAKDALVAAESAPARASAHSSRDAASSDVAPARTAESLPAARHDAAAGTSMEDPREGTLVVLDRDGVEHAEESGSFRFEYFDRKPKQKLVDEDTPSDEALGRSEKDDSARTPTLAAETVEVVRGRFRLDARRSRAIRLEAIELRGQRAVDGDMINIAKGGEIRARALWVEPVLVHVRDAATQKELEDVELVIETDWKIDHLHYPGTVRPEDVVGRGLRSPFSQPPPLVGGHFRARAHYWVRAPGHAWGDVGLAFDDGGEETVDLAPEAALTVVVGSGFFADTGDEDENDDTSFGMRRRPRRPEARFVRLRERSTDAEDVAAAGLAIRRLEAEMLGKVVTEVEARAGDLRFDGLEPGFYFATIETPVYRGSKLVAIAEVSLGAGESLIVIPAPAVADRVAIAGTLQVPASWDTKDLLLTLTSLDREIAPASETDRAIPLSQMTTVATQPPTWRWRFEGLTLGEYMLSVDRALDGYRFEVGPDGVRDISLVLPDVARVTAHVIDTESGAPVEVEGLVWEARRELRWSNGGTFVPIRDDGEPPSRRASSKFSGTFASGYGHLEVLSEAWTEDFAHATSQFAVGDQQIEVRVRRSIGIDVEFRLDGRRVFRPGDALGTVVRVDPIGEGGRQKLSFMKLETTRQLVAVTAPGWYRVTVPKLEGFAAIAPLDVLVDDAGFKKCVVELQKE